MLPNNLGEDVTNDWGDHRTDGHGYDETHGDGDGDGEMEGDFDGDDDGETEGNDDRETEGDGDGENFRNGVPHTDIPHGHPYVSATSCSFMASSSSNSIITQGETSNSDDVEVGDIFTSKKDLAFRLSVISMWKNFETRVDKSKKDVYVVKCRGNGCKWRLRAVRLSESNLFKISKYHNIHN